MTTFKVELPKLYYATGETVKGKVIYEPKASRKVYGIHLHFTGFEFCENSLLSDIPFQRKWILDGSTTLFGNKGKMSRNGKPNYEHGVNKERAVKMEAKRYVWPFSFQVPRNVPPSCEYRDGKVKIAYHIQALVDVPWRNSQKTAQEIRIGLPYVIDTRIAPQKVSNEKSFLIHSSSSSFKPSVLKMEAWINKQVTYSGDKILLRVKLDNNSGRSVRSLKIKLKQSWTYGAGNFEKSTIAKIKHKDRTFPLQQGEYSTEIPLVIPNCDLRPTIQNASLIRISYHFSITASIRAGVDLRVRIPVIIGSFPPLTKEEKEMKEKKEREDEKKEKEKKKKEKEDEDEEEEEEPRVGRERSNTAPLIIEWDATVPEQLEGQLEPLSPTKLSLVGQGGPPMHPERQPPLLDDRLFYDQGVSKALPNPAALREINFHQAMNELGDLTGEMDTHTQWASSGQLEHAIDIDPSLTIEQAHKSLEEANQKHVAIIQQLVNVSKSRDESQFFPIVEAFTTSCRELGSAAKVVAVHLGDKKGQQVVFQSMKTITLGTQQLILQGKEIIYHDPQRSPYTLDFMKDTMDTTAKNLAEYCNNLLALYKDYIANLRSKVGEVEKLKEAVRQSLQQFSNPFGGQVERKTLLELEASTQRYVSANLQLVEATRGSRNDILESSQVLIKATNTFLETAKGVSSYYPSLSQLINEKVQEAAAATKALLEIASSSLNKGHLSLNQRELANASRAVNVIAAQLIHLVDTEQKKISGEQLKEEEKKNQEEKEKETQKLHKEESIALEVKAEEDLKAVSKALAEAAQVLQGSLSQSSIARKQSASDLKQTLKVDYKFEVIGASNSVTAAITRLLQAASAAQNERSSLARDNKPENLYHTDPKWTAGLISAAKNIEQLIQKLVDATNAKELDDELIVSLARSISTSTAQLLSAERAKGDPNSQSRIHLNEAAKEVARTTAELVQKAKDAARHRGDPELPPGTPKRERKANTAITRVKELEAAVKIARLEKELEKARQDMYSLRKEDYGSGPE